MMTFQWEPLARLLNDGLEKIAQQDWREIGVDHDKIPLDVDWSHYQSLERAGIYRAIAARRNGRLVGYNSFHLGKHLRHRNAVFGQNDVLYLIPEQRRGAVGLRFLSESDALLKAAGAVKIRYDVQLHVRLGVSKGTLGDLLKRLGYVHTAEVFTKVLG